MMIPKDNNLNKQSNLIIHHMIIYKLLLHYFLRTWETIYLSSLLLTSIQLLHYRRYFIIFITCRYIKYVKILKMNRTRFGKIVGRRCIKTSDDTGKQRIKIHPGNIRETNLLKLLNWKFTRSQPICRTRYDSFIFNFLGCITLVAFCFLNKCCFYEMCTV